MGISGSEAGRDELSSIQHNYMLRVRHASANKKHHVRKTNWQKCYLRTLPLRCFGLVMPRMNDKEM